MVENRGPQLQAICIAFLVVAVVSTAARCYVRARMVKWFGVDDWFMVAAILCYIMFATCVIAGVHHGTGQRFADLTPDNIMKAMRYWWLCYIAYTSSMIFAKISIGYFLLRVTVARLQRRIIYFMVFLNVITGFVFLFVTAFQCTPLSYFWNRNQPGHCINVDIIIGLTYFFGSISALCDFTFGLLPVFLVWNLQMARREKIALVPILGMGCVASTAVLVRMAFVKEFRDPDFLWATVDIAIWSDIEPGLAITAGSLACLRPLVQLVASKLGLSTSRTPHPDYVQDPGHSAGRKGPKISGPFNLVSFSNGDKARLSSQEPSLEEGEGFTRDKKLGKVHTHGDGSEDELNFGSYDGELDYPPRAYAKSESIGVVGRYVHK